MSLVVGILFLFSSTDLFISSSSPPVFCSVSITWPPSMPQQIPTRPQPLPNSSTVFPFTNTLELSSKNLHKNFDPGQIMEPIAAPPRSKILTLKLVNEPVEELTWTSVHFPEERRSSRSW